MTIYLSDEAATLAFARHAAEVFTTGGLVFLQGTLGVGKTTFSRGLVQALGHQGAVKSPTYTLVEEYSLARFMLYHFDLYRLGAPEELEFMGIRDYLESDALCLVEWPEQGAGVLPQADLTLHFTDKLPGRELQLQAASVKGQAWLTQLMEF